jgi:hypothetical protein
MVAMEDQIKTEISHLSWGQIEVTISGRSYQYKDCLVWPGEAHEWNWNLTGTRHEPGIQFTDIEEMFKHNVEVVILSQGMFNRLQVCPETKQILENKGIEYHIVDTKLAVELYNDLTRQGKRVGAAFHSTC